MCKNIHPHLIVFSALESALTAHTRLPQFPFFLPSLTLNETTMSRFYGKDDQKSVVSLTRYYSTQYLKSAHTGASRGLLYCVVHSHAHVRLLLLHSGAIFFFFQPLSRFQSARQRQPSVEPNKVGLDLKK